MHDDDVIGDAHHEIDVVLDQQHGDPARQRLDQGVHLGGLGRRHALRRLVQHQDLGLERHADRDLDPALIAVGKVADQLIRIVVDTAFLEEFGGARLGSRAGDQAGRDSGCAARGFGRRA